MDEHGHRDAERRLWDDAGAAPIEHIAHLERNDVDVRVQEVGSGPPVVFLHGGPGATGAIWAHLAAMLPDLRCLLVDRPGTGLSSARHPTNAIDVRRECETLVVDVLDALSLDSAHLVGSSHGGFIALLAAALHPERVDRIVQLGCPAFVEGMRLRAADRIFLLGGARHLAALARPSEKALARTFRQLGHAKTLDAGGLSPVVVDWCLSVMRHTDTMRNELRAMAAMGTFRRGFDPILTVDDATLAGIAAPTHYLWGEHEVFGDFEVARRVTAAMPAATLEVLPDAGHLCWFDDLEHAARVVRSHLLASAPTL